MITEQDLLEAIAECQGQKNPNASTCIKLAAFYTIRDAMFGKEKPPMSEYSYSAPPVVQTDGESEFLKAVEGKNIKDVFAIMDELMDTMQVLQPRIYDSVMRKLDRL